MTLRVYVAAPFQRRAQVRDIHEAMRGLRIEPTARWADGNESEGDLDLALARFCAAQNDEDIDRSHALLVTAYPGEGAEMFSECTRALLAQTPIVWVGRRSLSSWRPGVVIAPSIEGALATLVAWRDSIRRDWPTELRWGRQTIWNGLLEREAEMDAALGEGEAA